MRRAFLTLAAAAIATPLRAAPPEPGPVVGARVPAFDLHDSHGARRNLTSILGPSGAVLVFFRSARWCTECQERLIALKAMQAPLAQRGYGLAAISYDAPTALATFAEKQGLGFTLLSDEGSKTIDAFGLRDARPTRDSFAYGIPYPAVLVLDRRGVMKANLMGDGPVNDWLLKTVDGLNRGGAVGRSAPAYPGRP